MTSPVAVGVAPSSWGLSPGGEVVAPVARDQGELHDHMGDVRLGAAKSGLGVILMRRRYGRNHPSWPVEILGARMVRDRGPTTCAPPGGSVVTSSKIIGKPCAGRPQGLIETRVRSGRASTETAPAIAD